MGGNWRLPMERNFTPVGTFSNTGTLVVGMNLNVRIHSKLN